MSLEIKEIYLKQSVSKSKHLDVAETTQNWVGIFSTSKFLKPSTVKILLTNINKIQSFGTWNLKQTFDLIIPQRVQLLRNDEE